jgi:hypothetical protein
MLYSEIIAVCSQIYTKHINTLCGQNAEFVNVKVKARPITCYEGQPGYLRYPPTLSLSSAIEGGAWLMSRPGRFTPG